MGKLKTNGQRNLAGSKDIYFYEDNMDPSYKMFLEHLREDGKSYILEMEDGDNGLPVFLKYENFDEFSYSRQLDAALRSGHCCSVGKGKSETKKSRICRKLEAQSNEIVPFSGNLWNNVSSNGEFLSIGNRSIELSYSFKNQAESNLADDAYQEFLSHLKIQNGLLVFEYNSTTVIYEDNHKSAATKKTCFEDQGPMPMKLYESTQSNGSPKLANEGFSCSDNKALVLYESNMPPEVDICEADEMFIVPLDSYILSPFDLRLRAVLSKPYDEQEHEMLWTKATSRKPVQRHKDLRSQSKWFNTGKMGLSYLDHYPDFARKMAHSEPQHALNLLRGLFFWLENLCHEGAYQPWILADPIIVEISDHE